MDNLSIYNAVRKVPPEALREIKGGRLSGKTDINPMWRIKTLTEQFGPCGIGWYYIIRNKQLEKGSGSEVAAFVDIDLYYKANGEWSMPIPGTGGSMFVAQEKNGPYTSDECFKMALTDAISVSAKALGVAADVYWDKDKSKYDSRGKEDSPAPEPKQALVTKKQARALVDLAIVVWGEKAKEMLTITTGYERAMKVPASEFCNIMAKLEGLKSA